MNKDDSEDGQEFVSVRKETRYFKEWHLRNFLEVSRHWKCFGLIKIWSSSKAAAQDGTETNKNSKKSAKENYKTSDERVRLVQFDVSQHH